MNRLPSLTNAVAEYVRLEMPAETQLFIVDENLEAIVASRQTSVSGTHRLAIHQIVSNNDQVHRIQIFASLPLEKRFRILLLDWDQLPRNRAIMGYLLYERMAGILLVSDFRMSLARGEIPRIFRDDTVYMLGIRFEGIQKPVQITSLMTDSAGILYRDAIVTKRVGLYKTFVSANQANTMRPSANPSRILNVPTRVIDGAQTATIEEVNTTNAISTVSSTIATQTTALAIQRPRPIVTVAPFRPNTDNRYENYPDPAGSFRAT